MTTTQQTVTWYGSSGAAYEYGVYSLEPIGMMCLQLRLHEVDHERLGSHLRR